MRRWIVGPEGRSRGRRRGLAARLMDVASYDDEGAQALEAAIEAARALPSDGWLQRIVEGSPFGPIEALLGEVRGTVYARAKAQDAGYGLETELAEPDGALVAAAAKALEGLEALLKPLAALEPPARGGARRCAGLARFSQARARVDGAINGLSWRREILSAWIALLGADRRVGRPRVRRLAGDRARRGPRVSTSRSIATGSTRPSRSPARCSSRRRACW